METLGGLALHSAPAPSTPAPALRAASPSLPAMVRGQQSWPAPHATDIEALPDGPTPSRSSMWFRYLTASALCAALLALAASGLVRTHFSKVMSALAPTTSEASPVDAPIQADRDSLPVMDPAPEGEMTAEMHPTSLFLRKDAKAHTAASARIVSPHNPLCDTFAQDLDRGIRKLAERRYEIKRSTLDLALGNLGLLARSVRVMPEARDGKPLGFRLFAITADGPIAKLGLRNNDVLVSINGLDLTTPDRVLDAYGKLKEAPALDLGVAPRERRSSPRTIRFGSGVLL